MEIQVVSDTTSLSYWLNWRFFLCALWVFTSMFVAAFIVWKYEYSKPSESEGEAEEAWRPCVKEIHPIFLSIFRIIAFCSSLTALIIIVVDRGGSLFYYYTQWTFTLVTIYFGFGSMVSIYGCFQHHKACSPYNNDEELGPYVPLIHGEAVNGVRVEKNLDHQEKYHVLRTSLGWSRVFQILFQMTAGAVVLTDCLYWCVIFPFLTIKDYDLNFLTVLKHSLNVVLLLGDTALNGLQFPWFRISYFVLLTGVYVIFEWIVHAFVSIWWPYPFLDLSSPYAPILYLVVGLMHIPCYALFALLIKAKYYLLSRWFPPSSINICNL